MSNNNFAINLAPSVKLYLFSRRFVPNQARRSLIYDFNGLFRTKVMDHLSGQGTNFASRQVDALLTDPVARTAILPDSIGTHMDLHNFGDFWTFLLVVNNIDTYNSTLGTKQLPSCLMYSGWIMDEPCSPSAEMAGQYVFNNNCIFQISHFINMVGQQFVTQSGPKQMVDVNADFDYVNAHIAEQISGTGDVLYELTPSKLAGSTIVNTDNPFTQLSTNMYDGKPAFSEIAISTVPMKSNPDGSTEIPTELANPVSHLSHIVGSMREAVNFGIPDPGFDVVTGPNAMVSNFALTAKLGTAPLGMMIDPKRPYTFGELNGLFGNILDVCVVRQPFSLEYGVADATVDATAKNIMSAVISSSMPSILTSIGISDIGFRYDGTVTDPNVSSQAPVPKGMFNLYRMGTLFPVSDQSYWLMWSRFQTNVRYSLLPIIQDALGAFNLNVHCSISGSTLIEIESLDSLNYGGYVETNNLLGGLNTTAMGNELVHQTNAVNLFHMLGDMTATSPVGLF